MPRYVIERTFPAGLELPISADGARAAREVIDRNTEVNAVWLHSYVTPDRRKTFCLYEGPSPEAVHEAAARNGLPIDRVTEIRVLDPYFLT